mgnify:CR=1 FL=1
MLRKDVCPACLKARDLCLCDHLVRRDNRFPVLILQHPQEPDKELGSALLTTLILANSRLRTGFSVPNLSAALGRPADPSKWIVLYLGSKYKFQKTAEQAESYGHSELAFYNRKDEPLLLDPAGIEGVVAIDGTWAQAKALWWRNPWLLKLTRAAVLPRSRSRYGELRREPRRECVSTIEAIAYTLEALGDDPAIPQALVEAFGELVRRYRDRGKAGKAEAGKAHAKAAPEDDRSAAGIHTSGAAPVAAGHQNPAGQAGPDAAGRPLTRAQKAAAARQAATSATEAVTATAATPDDPASPAMPAAHREPDA